MIGFGSERFYPSQSLFLSNIIVLKVIFHLVFWQEKRGYFSVDELAKGLDEIFVPLPEISEANVKASEVLRSNKPLLETVKGPLG